MYDENQFLQRKALDSVSNKVEALGGKVHLEEVPLFEVDKVVVLNTGASLGALKGIFETGSEGLAGLELLFDSLLEIKDPIVVVGSTESARAENLVQERQGGYQHRQPLFVVKGAIL